MSQKKIKTKLNSKWTLWYHCPDDKSWAIDSYKKIFDFDTVEDFWILNEKITPNHIQYGMFFITRDNILPLWEDEKNINGGCWSFKLPKKDTYKAWIELSVFLVGETLYSNDDKFEINAISISPKKNFSILKIWNKNNEINSIDNLNINLEYFDLKSAIYKSHIN